MRGVYRCDDCRTYFRAVGKRCLRCVTGRVVTGRVSCPVCGSRLVDVRPDRCPSCGSTAVERVRRGRR